MSLRWIPAPRALSLLDELSGGRDFRQVLIKRAASGALKSKADVLHLEGDTLLDVVLKPAFWDWDRYAEAEEHWQCGDFVATIDGLRSNAMGVCFELGALSHLLPIEMRPQLLRSVSVAGDPGWVSAKAARAFMYNDLKAAPTQAGAVLIDQCRLGFVAARAAMKQERPSSDRVQKWSNEEAEWDIPQWFWENFTGFDTSSQDWERGQFVGVGRAPSGCCAITLTGVYFLRASLEAMIPANPASSPTSSGETVATGGRPPAAFWDDLWCSIWGRIFRGEFIPERQADIERVMLDWASANGHELSDTAARGRARKLFAEYQLEGKNPV